MIDKDIFGLMPGAVASNAFRSAMSMQNLRTTSTTLAEMFSASAFVKDLADQVEEWKAQAPEGQHLVMMLRTPNGEMMDVESIESTGWQMFTAKGYINGAPFQVAAHISTLSIKAAYEETKKGKNPPGFTVIARPLKEPELAPSPESPDNPSPTP